jgi:hypothetical protein
MIDITRRLAVAVVVLTLAAPLLADSIHPDLKRSKVVSLDVASIERNAQDGTPFELPVGEKGVKVALVPDPIWPEEGLTILEVQRDGSTKKSVVKGDITYSGEVAGEESEEAAARFTIVDGVLVGSVRTSAGAWFLEPLARFNPKADKSQYVVYEAHDTAIHIDFGGDAVRSDTVYDPHPPIKCPTRDGRIRVSMASDREYIAIPHVLNFWQRQTALLHEINWIYQHQFRKQFRLGLAISDSNNLFLRSTDAEALLVDLDDLVAPWLNLNPAQELCSDLVHLTTGKDLDRNVLGTGNQPGATSLTQQTAGNNEFLYLQNYIVMAHEIGHNFDAIHAEAVQWCEPIPEDPFHCRWKQTLDWEAFDAVRNVPHFSDGTFGECKDNEQRMKANMGERGLWP